MSRLGIEFISVFGLPPLEFAALASDLGCEAISLGLHPLEINPHGYDPYSLHDRGLQRDFRAALADNGVRLALAEGFFILPGHSVSAYAGEIDTMAALGAERLNTIVLETDESRARDELAVLAQMAAERGLETVLEFIPGTPAGDLQSAATLVRRVGRPDLRLLVDTMHLGRSGGRAEDLAALEPDLVGYVQLCDVPRERNDMSYEYEAKFERLAPGAGDLPLLAYLQALPRNLPIGLEAPQRGLAEAGVAPRDRLSPWVRAAQQLLAQRDRGGPV